MGKKNKLLKSVEFIVYVVFMFVFVNISRGARLPDNARVKSVKVNSVPKIEKNSVVPKVSVGSLAEVILIGVNLAEGIQAVLTKREGKQGEGCDSNSIVSPTYRLQSYKNLSNSYSMYLSPDTTTYLGISNIDNVWVCLSQVETSDKNTSLLFKNSSHEYLFVHMGKRTKIGVSKSSLDGSYSSSLHYNQGITKRAIDPRKSSSHSKDEDEPVSEKDANKDISASSSSLFLNKVDSKERTSDIKISVTSGYRTSDSANESYSSVVDVSGSSVLNSTNSVSENYFSLNNNTVFTDELSDQTLVPVLSRGHRDIEVSDTPLENSIIPVQLLESKPQVHLKVTDELSDQTLEPVLSRGHRDIEVSDTPLENSIIPVQPIESKPQVHLKARIYGIRVVKHAKGISYSDGVIELQAGYDAEIMFFGSGLTQDISVQFTAVDDVFGSRCDVSTSDVFPLTTADGHWATSNVNLPAMAPSQKVWYLCMREGTEGVAVHQGSDEWLTISTYELFLPVWIQVIILIFLLILSGLFSGLNLGLMALDKTELKIVMNTGTPVERKYAKSIEPVRRHGNFLLCTLLLGNVLVNSTLTILLDTLSSGLIAVVGSTIGIVIFGEIVPQAICSRHGLAIGARTVWLVRIFMIITGVVSWPISKILDVLLGEEIGNTYDRERLKELIRVTQDRNDLRLEEQNIIYGALELHRKTVAEVMTKLDDVYMLNIDRCLDFNTINEIMQQGYSRIPIYDNERTNLVSVLLIKDLAFIDPDDNTPLRTVIQFYNNVCNFVFEDTTLDVIFKEFKEGNKGHMAFVQRVNNEGECDPFYEVIGLVTLEDVIEELIQEEIVDETDVFTDNKTKRRRKHIRRDFKEFSQQNPGSHKKIQISPQMQVAAFQYLRTSVEPFKEGNLSEGILKRMLNQDIIHTIKIDPSNSSQQNFIFVQAKPVDFFVLILEGHVEVTIGKENLTFESGPFTYFGLMALTMTPLGESPSLSTQLSRSSIVGSMQSLDASKLFFTPDYSVKATTEVTFLKVKRSHYIAARRAYLMEQSQRDPLAEETFEKEMEKILRDESVTSPVWEVSSAKEPDVKDALLNGGALVAKDEDQLELSVVANGRRHSLRETLLIHPRSPNKQASSDDSGADNFERFSASSLDDKSQSENRPERNGNNSPM